MSTIELLKIYFNLGINIKTTLGVLYNRSIPSENANVQLQSRDRLFKVSKKIWINFKKQFWIPENVIHLKIYNLHSHFPVF